MRIALFLFLLILVIRHVGFQEMRARGVSGEEIQKIIDARNKECLPGFKIFAASLVLALVGLVGFLTILEAVD